MPTYLVPQDTTYRPVLMDRAILFFGRHPDCDVIITCSRKVSRKHCCVAQIDDYFVVRDLGSMNGIWVNGKSTGRESVLRVGDVLHVGDVLFDVKGGHYELPKGKLVIGPPPVRTKRAAAKKPDAKNTDKTIAQTPPRPKPPARPTPPARPGKPAVAAASDSFDDLLDQTPNGHAGQAGPAGDVFDNFAAQPHDRPSEQSMEILLGDDDIIEPSELNGQSLMPSPPASGPPPRPPARPPARGGSVRRSKGESDSDVTRPSAAANRAYQVERPMTALPIADDDSDDGFLIVDAADD